LFLDGSFLRRALTIKALFEEARRILEEVGIEGAKIMPPKSPKFGEAYTNYPFEVAKRLGARAQDLATEIAAKLRPRGLIGRIEAVGQGYINFYADWPRFSESTVREALEAGEGEYGSSRLGEGRVVLVEHTSVNPNKPLHIGHARNVVLGDLIYRLFSKNGFKVYVLNYVDDSGSQMASILLGLLELGYPETPPEGVRFDEYCGDTVYVGVNKAMEEDLRLEARLREITRRIEDRGDRMFRYAREIAERVLVHQLQTCWRLGARYDILFRESDVIASGLWAETFPKLVSRGIAYRATEGVKSGCWCIDLSSHPVLSKEGDEVLVKSDGATTYVARDIAFALWKLGESSTELRAKTWGRNPDGSPILITDQDEGEVVKLPKPALVITVVGSEQRRPQDVVKYALTKLGADGDRYIHFSYERVSLSQETAARLGAKVDGGRAVPMSGRRGLYVKVEEVLDDLRSLAEEETRKRHPDWSVERVREVAEAIARSAFRYATLRPEPDKPVVFDVKESSRLDGDTGPYIQYSLARAYRIVERASEAGLEPSPKPSHELVEEERMLVRVIAYTPWVIEETAGSLYLRQLVTHAREMALRFNEFYERCPVVGGGEASSFRLALVKAFINAQTSLMWVLGLPALREM
jgi:arginyl-tRNA synthetase